MLRGSPDSEGPQSRDANFGLNIFWAWWWPGEGFRTEGYPAIHVFTDFPVSHPAFLGVAP